MKTSIIVLTHNRSALLKKCLDSLTPQLKGGDEIIVVNNHSTQEETKKIKALIKKSKKKIRHVFHPTNSIPRGRNKGIENVRKGSRIIAFIDDDCLTSKGWLRNIKAEHQAHRNWQAIQGKVICLPKNNLYARITGLTYQNWLRSNLLDKNLLATIDTKNVSFKSGIFKFLKFDEKFDKSSDVDFGLRLTKMGFKIGYSPKIRTAHQERTSLIPFLKQHIKIAQGECQANVGLLPSRYKHHVISLAKLAYQLFKEKKFLSLSLFLVLVPIILILRMGVFLSRPW